MKKILVAFTDELIAALNEAAMGASRQAFIEEELRRCPSIQAAASRLGLTFTDRPKRGKWERKEKT